MTKAQKKAFAARMKAAREKNPRAGHKRKSASKANHSHNPRCGSRRSRNPEVLGRSPAKLLKEILTALVSMVATKQIPQEVMQSNNAGWQGYLANLATAFAATIGAHALFGPDEALAAAIGGGAIIVDRVLTEQFSPIGNYLSLTGLGDATAARQLGGVGQGYFVQPTIYDSNGNPVIPHQITDAAVARFLALQPAAPATATGGGSSTSTAMVPSTQSSTPVRYKRGPGN